VVLSLLPPQLANILKTFSREFVNHILSGLSTGYVPEFPDFFGEGCCERAKFRHLGIRERNSGRIAVLRCCSAAVLRSERGKTCEVRGEGKNIKCQSSKSKCQIKFKCQIIGYETRTRITDTNFERNGFWATAPGAAKSDFSGDLASFRERRGIRATAHKDTVIPAGKRPGKEEKSEGFAGMKKR